MTTEDAACPNLTVDGGFESVVRPHLPAMRRLAAALFPGLDPDDVVQEALVQAWRKRHTYRAERGSVRTWLLAITADRARRLRRRRSSSEPTFELRDEADLAPPPDLALREAIKALPNRQRQAILLFYYVDLSLEETARLMGCALGTVKSTLADARRNLAHQLGGTDE